MPDSDGFRESMIVVNNQQFLLKGVRRNNELLAHNPLATSARYTDQ
jgi:hypothetical protein